MFNKVASLLCALLLTCSVHAEVHLAQYGVQYVAPFNLFNADGTLDTDESDSGTEVSVRCQGGSNTTATNDFVDRGSDYEITLTATEMQCATVAVTVAATVTSVFYINTVNNASAAIPQLNANVTQFGGSAGTFSGGRPEVNTTHLAGTSQTGRDIGASVLLSNGTGTGQLKLASGYVAMTWADVAAPTTTINLSGTTVKTATDVETDTADIQTRLPAALVSGRMSSDAVALSGDTTAADRLEAMLDGTCGSYPELGILRGAGCTAQAYTAGTPSITLDSSAAFGDNTLTGATIMICGSTQGYCQPALAASNVGSTDVVTLTAALPVEATGTVTYTIYGTAPASGGSGATAAEVWAYSSRTLTALDEDSTTIDLNASYVGGVAVLDEDLTTIDINATTIGTATTVTTTTNLTNLPTIPANWLTAAGIAPDAGTEFATAIWSIDATGLQTQGTFGQIIGDSASDSDSIWAKVNNLTFTVSGQVDANTESMNAQPVCGTGDSGTPWTGCP